MPSSRRKTKPARARASRSAAATPAVKPARRTKWEFDAAIFDMDGVITETAAVHSLAWKQMFDEYLKRRERKLGEPFKEFSHTHDYLKYVDGKPRYQGVASFLESRSIKLPAGSPDDAPDAETIAGLGNRKNQLFNHIIETSGVRVFGSTLVLIHDLRRGRIKVGLATSSRNSALILAKTQTRSLFGTVVDGIVSEQLGLKGKPHPDIFTTASANLRVAPARAIVVEDAVSGVRAGAAGGFALVIGVARERNEAELRTNGADVVVRDLAEINLEEINRQVRLKRGAA
ncbi:MAG TPA: beta-phosphoglucomutase family hydrolase [Candidatus Didemnitutus sp.]|nr:beta-phosphoglucomutase family hydrolase [Candidatus Didemnitutus sp.]